jgi:glycosyltransferase involved in cell wall biosynthesis
MLEYSTVKTINTLPFTFYHPRKIVKLHAKSLSIPKQNLIVWAGRLEIYKNPLFAITIARKYQTLLRQHDFRMVIAGKGALEDAIHAEIQRYRLTDIVSVEYYHDITKLFLKSKIYISTQIITNYPSQALIEAYICNNVILCSDTGDSRLFEKYMPDSIFFYKKDNFPEVFQSMLARYADNTAVAINNDTSYLLDGVKQFVEFFTSNY